jgi:ribokinase
MHDARLANDQASMTNEGQLSMDVVVIGSYVMALTERLPRMPHAGESLVADLLDVGPGGKGTNTAVTMARQGKRVGFIAKIGADMFGDYAMKLYAGEGIDTRFVYRDSNEPTGVALVYLETNGENRIAVYRGANWLLTPAEVEAIEPHMAGAKVINAQLEVNDDAVAAGFALGRTHGLTTILNPAPARPLSSHVLANVDILTPNEGEARLIAGLPMDDATTPMAEVAQRLLRIGPRTVIITLGAQGCVIAQPGTAPIHVPAYPVSVVDTVGAGDAFNAGLAVALCDGKPLIEAARWACVTAALSVMHVGAIPGLPNRTTVEQHYAYWRHDA